MDTVESVAERCRRTLEHIRCYPMLEAARASIQAEVRGICWPERIRLARGQRPEGQRVTGRVRGQVWE
jgi:hypothetical protein